MAIIRMILWICVPTQFFFIHKQQKHKRKYIYIDRSLVTLNKNYLNIHTKIYEEF